MSWGREKEEKTRQGKKRRGAGRALLPKEIKYDKMKTAGYKQNILAITERFCRTSLTLLYFIEKTHKISLNKARQGVGFDANSFSIIFSYHFLRQYGGI